jgi:hypothetical protein
VKVLLDECVDTRLASHLSGFDVVTVADKAWAGISNGKLLALAQVEFDVFVTVDKNLSFQQHLPKFGIAVVVMRVASNRLADLVTIVPDLLAAMPNATKGEVFYVGR